MPKNHREARLEAYFKLSSQIAHMDNTQLSALFDDSERYSGWGVSHSGMIGRSKVFVKRVPLTDIEYDHMFSTKNLFKLPTYYNYGVGSAGFGAFRELVTHIKTTNWVLEGRIETFPLMYHYRIIPFFGTRAEVDMERHKRYVAYWGNSTNVGRYLLERANASYALIFCLEYIPHTVSTWLLANLNKASMVIADMRATITFLRQNGIIHLDPHLANIVTDGRQAYLTDFGLALDKRFALTPAEQSFYQQNTYYDYGEFLWSMGSHLFRIFQHLAETDKHRLAEKLEVPEGAEFEAVMPILLNNIEELSADGTMKLDRNYVASVTTYRSIITLMHDFYSELRSNPRKDTRFPHARLQQLLKETGFIGDSM